MKKGMYIIVLVIISILIFNGCGEKENIQQKNISKVEQTTEKKEKISQDELNKKIQDEAVKADFVQINDGKMKNKSVFVEGKISNIIEDPVMPKFTLTSKEGNGNGIYTIVVFQKELMKNIKEGNTITVYGKVMDKDNSGITEISGNVLKQQ